MSSSRLIITLDNEDKRWLEGYTRLRRISMAEGIRRGLRILREQEGNNSYQSIVDHTGGIWKKGDGLKYQKKIRSEWDKT